MLVLYLFLLEFEVDGLRQSEQLKMGDDAILLERFYCLVAC